MEELKVLPFQIKGQTFEIKFPSIGDYRKIEVFKQTLSNGQYFNMVRGGLDSSNEALDIIDVESYFSVLCPTLLEAIDKKAGSFADLGLMDFNELKEEYLKQFVPWWNKILELIRNK